MLRIVRIGGWILMALLGLGVAAVSLRYFALDPALFFERQRDVYHAHLGRLLVHAGGGIAALALGPWQFWGGLRNRALRLHRVLGRIYLISVMVGGAGGLAMATLAYGGLPSRAGFGFLAAFWLATGGLAYRAIRRGEVERHRAWMIRNYALTFAAVTLRAWVPLLEAGGFGFEEAYVTTAWLSWVLNLVLAEVYLGARARWLLPAAGAAGR